MQCCLGSLGQHCRDFLPVQCCLKSIKAKLHRTSIYPMLSGAFSDNIAYGFDLSNVIPRVLRQHCTGFGLMHCCLEPLEYNCIRFWPVQSWPKSIKRKLYRIFSYAMLSGACQVKHVEFWPAKCCPKSIKTKLHRIFLYNVARSLSDSIT